MRAEAPAFSIDSVFFCFACLLEVYTRPFRICANCSVSQELVHDRPAIKTQGCFSRLSSIYS